MNWDPQHQGQLELAIANLDRVAVDALCQRLVEHVAERDQPFPLKQAKTILSFLRRKRFFSQLTTVADAFLRSEQTAGIIRRLYAQGLIEQGELTAAVGVLEKLIVDCAEDAAEIAEARGLIGRALKQQYVDGKQKATPARARLINRAVAAYRDVYGMDPTTYLWHGINAVACAMRAARDGIALERTIDASGIAEEILRTIRKKPEDQIPFWDLATAAEASVALGRPSEALEWHRQYVAKPTTETDAFEVASTLRQLEQVWQLREDGGELGELVTVLKAALLQREGGTVTLAPVSLDTSLERARPNREAFEKVFGDAGPRTYNWYMSGALRARAVARVEDRFGRGVGTGFLVRARDFLASATEKEVLFLTNAHVLGRTDPGALPLEAARVRFEAAQPDKTYAVEKLLWESPQNELDATLVRLGELEVDIEPLSPAPPEPPDFIEGDPRRFYVIGHPLGGTLSISIDDNLQVGWRRPQLHYRTPTHPGNSGSPVLDEDWRLVALHHAGSKQMPRLDAHPGYYEANEGIWIHDIILRARGESAPGRREAHAVVSDVNEELGTNGPARSPKRLFVSYSHSDRKFLSELQKVLKPLMRDDELVLWSDTDISVGANWKVEIDESARGASVAVLLVSTDYLASDFIAREEFPQILKRSEEHGVRVVWIPVGSSFYERTPLARFQAASDPKRPLNSLTKAERQRAWVEIARQIIEI